MANDVALVLLFSLAGWPFGPAIGKPLLEAWLQGPAASMQSVTGPIGQVPV